MNGRPKFGRITPSNQNSEINQQSSQITQSQQLPIPSKFEQYVSTPMPPPTNPLIISQQVQSQISQQQSSIPEQQLDTSYVSYNQNNLIKNPYNERETTVIGQIRNQPGYYSDQEINKPPPQFNQSSNNYIYQEPQQHVVYRPPTQTVQQSNNVYELQKCSSIIINSQEIENTQISEILENSRIISNSKIKEMEISSNTHNMITIEEKTNEFIIQPFDEKLKKDKQKIKQLFNSNLFIIQNKSTTIPEFQCQERLCQLHNKQIEKICAEQDCKENNELLLCQDCARYHKGHNQYDIHEALFLIQKSQDTLENDDSLIETIKNKTFQQFKILKSNITFQLNQIEEQLQNGFDHFKQYIQEKKSSYQEAFNDLQFGGLSKMIEQTNFLFDQGLFLEINQNSNESQYKELAIELDKVKLQMRKFEQFVEEIKYDHVSIKLNNGELLIETQKIEDLNDLYYQIKIEALKQKFTNILDQELLLLQNNKAIRLKGNHQEINLKDQQKIQIISYQQI